MKTAFITGANRGIGLETARQLALVGGAPIRNHPALLLLVLGTGSGFSYLRTPPANAMHFWMARETRVNSK